MVAKATFEQWMQLVNLEIGQRIGMDYRDLPDIPYRDLYDAGKSAKAAARRAIRSAKDF